MEQEKVNHPLIPSKKQLEYLVEEVDSVEHLQKLFALIVNHYEKEINENYVRIK